MRITDRYQSLIERTGAGAARPTETANKSDRAGNARSVAKRAAVLDVSVSDRAQELASGAARLEELKTAIRNGTFRVDPQVIAARLVGEDEA